MKKTHVKMLPAMLAIATALASATTAYAQSDPKAELMAMAQKMQPFSMRMLGPPVGTSEWVFVVKPFWTDKVKELSAGKVKVTLNSVTEINAPPADALRLVSQGTFDMTNQIANYSSGDVPTLDGFDLAGVATSTDAIKKVLTAYEPAAQAALQKRYKVDLLGVGMSGAQAFFCKGQIKNVSDLKNKKVRASSSTVAELVQGLGAVPVPIAFGELVPALQRGVIDCAITGTMSGNTAKLIEVSDTMYTLVVGWAPSIQVINSKSMAKLDDEQRAWLNKAMTYYYKNFSDVIQTENVNQGIWCNTGDKRCTMAGQGDVTMGHMTLVEPTQHDLAAVREAVKSRVLPAYGKACGKECAEAWNNTVGKVEDMKIPIN